MADVKHTPAMEWLKKQLGIEGRVGYSQNKQSADMEKAMERGSWEDMSVDDSVSNRKVTDKDPDTKKHLRY